MSIVEEGGNFNRNGRAGSVTPCFFRKLAIFATMGLDEIDYLQRMESHHGSLPAGTDIIRAGDDYGAVFILNQGWAIRYAVMADGRRQIANFVLPGDFMCLNATIFPRSEHTIETITPVTYSRFDIADIVGLTENYPLLSAAIFWCNAREESLLLEHLTSVGRRSAYERIAHMLVELWRRLELLGLTEEGGFALPLTQVMIADAAGLTPIHVNRMMRALETDKLIEYRRKSPPRLFITDIKRLEAAAGFDAGYLHFTEIPKRTRMVLESFRRARKGN